MTLDHSVITELARRLRKYLEFDTKIVEVDEEHTDLIAWKPRTPF